jgi:hypothetical protein
MEHCRVVLGDDDYDAIVMFRSPNQLITAIRNLEIQYSGGGTIPRLLNRIVPQLQTLNTFITVVLFAVGLNTISTACIWGAMSLLIQVSLFLRPFLTKFDSEIAGKPIREDAERDSRTARWHSQKPRFI